MGVDIQPTRHFCRSKVQRAPRPRLLHGSTKGRRAACARGGKTQKTSDLFCFAKRSQLHLTVRFGIAGVEFIDENGGGPGVRLRKGQQKKG